MTVTSAQPSVPVEDALPVGLVPPGDGESRRSATCDLAPSFESVGRARAFVRRLAPGWQLGELTDDIQLVVTELVANALRHGLGLRGDPKDAERPQIRLRLLRTGSRVMCTVEDPSAELPVRLVPDLATGSGRGLQLIESLSTYWGWTLAEEAGRVTGKTVWAVFAVGRPGAGGAPIPSVSPSVA